MPRLSIYKETMTDILERILATKAEEVAAAKTAVPLDEIKRQAEAAPPVRDFVTAIRAKHAANQPAVIAEIKRTSPSKGLIRAISTRWKSRLLMSAPARPACRCSPMRLIFRARPNICSK